MDNKYKATDKMSALICNDYKLLQAMSRFGISMGVGDKSVEEVCREQGVDCNTFLRVVNFICDDTDHIEENLNDLNIQALMDYLRQSHSYFLEFQLPFIRRKLIEAIDCSKKNEVAYAILKYYDDYVGEVRNHMDYEDQTVFMYVTKLLNGKKPSHYNIGIFLKKHTPIDVRLAELKNIIIKYYPGDANNNLLNSTLYDIFSCEEDLASHMRVEEYLFIPAVRKLEEEDDEE